MTNIKTFGVALLPDHRTEALLKYYSKCVPKNLFDLESSRTHLSLLQIVGDDALLSKLGETVETLKAPAAVPLMCYEVHYTHSGWGFLKVRKTDLLDTLQKKFLPLTPLRQGDTSFYWRKNATQLQRETHRVHGYPNIGKAWDPHFSFGLSSVPRQESRHDYVHQGKADAIAIGTFGQNGVLEHLLHVRQL